MVLAISLSWLMGCGGPGSDLASQPEAAAPKVGQLERFHWGCTAGSRGRLLSVQWTGAYHRWALEDYWNDWLNGLATLGYVDDTVDPEIRTGADTFEVEYCTVDHDGQPIRGTGLLAMPRTLWQAPTVVYAHGTAVTRIDTPSNPDPDEVFDGPSPMVIFAGSGYNFIAPDYTGFGGSDADRHRYFDAQTAAANELDMLRAVECYWLYWLKADGDLYNLGFSQGGHTALAFGELAEDNGYDIEGTAVIGAVPDPDAWYEWLLGETDNPYLQLYGAYLLVSYDDVYDVYDDPSDAFAPPYDATVEGLFDMEHYYDEVVAGLPGSAAELLTADYLAEVSDPSSEFRTRLQENAVDGVCLDGPIRMWHSIGDDEVPFFLAEDAQAALATCNDVSLVEWRELDHLNTWHEVLPETRDWFDSL